MQLDDVASSLPPDGVYVLNADVRSAMWELLDDNQRQQFVAVASLVGADSSGLRWLNERVPQFPEIVRATARARTQEIGAFVDRIMGA